MPETGLEIQQNGAMSKVKSKKRNVEEDEGEVWTLISRSQRAVNLETEHIHTDLRVVLTTANTVLGKFRATLYREICVFNEVHAVTVIVF